MFCGLLAVKLQAQVAYVFMENKGQWNFPAQFRSELPGAMMYLSGNEILFDVWDAKLQGTYYHKAKFGESVADLPSMQQRHAYKQVFLNANPNPNYKQDKASSAYYNFYTGNDSAQWQSGLYGYKELRLQGLYKGIDMLYSFSNQQLKYDFILEPYADPQAIMWTYEGISKSKIRKGEIVLETAVGEVREVAPLAWQIINGKKVMVELEFKKRGDVFSFDLISGYNPAYELVIDPLLIFSTYVGSFSDSWGYTATPGADGSGYAGGIVFGNNYPTSLGAYQSVWGAGGIDAVISKFSPNGNQLLYSSFLGGAGPDMPHSIIESASGELYILGTTGSLNFPVTAGAYDPSFNGGPALNFFGTLIQYPQGVDLFVSRLSANGTALPASTFLGGTQSDGLNLSAVLAANYADEFRGEIILDAANNVYIASVSNSSNFPLVSPVQPVFGGGTSDAVFCKLDAALSNLLVSTYYGGSGDEAGYSVQRSSTGIIYFTGGTTSNNLTTTAGVIQPNALGGADGFLLRLSPAGTSLQAATYIGTPTYNQTYFVQLDTNDNVYVMGQTVGGYPIQAAAGLPVYSVPNSGQFIHKLSPNLQTTLMSTCFGSGGGGINISPTAFLLHDCNQIYIAGWGGSVNQMNGGIGGSTLGLPTTPGAYKTVTNGNDFYLAVLEQDAQSLLYATFMGGNSSNNHVDGGTSRFDKKGVVYQAMCASCGGQDDLPTTPGAYSSTNNSTNCNIALVKFDVSVLTAYLDVTTTTVCQDELVLFENESNGGVSFFWDFGDGNTHVGFQASHAYTMPGTYQVMLIASDPQNCVANDTAFVTLTVNPKPIAVIDSVPEICPTTSVQLQGSGGDDYFWLPAAGLAVSEQQIPNPTVTPPQSMSYFMIASNDCGADTAVVFVPVIDFEIEISDSDTICVGNATQLECSGGTQYVWSPAFALSDPNIANPIAEPTSSTVYTVTVTNPDNCVLSDSVYIQVDFLTLVQAGADSIICQGDSMQLSGSGVTHYAWSPPDFLSNPSIANPIANPPYGITYVLTGRNACGESTDTQRVEVKIIEPVSGPDTLVCPGSEVMLFTNGGTEYQWYPVAYLDSANIATPTATVTSNVDFWVMIKDELGCTTTDTVHVQTYAIQNVSAGPDRYLDYGESTILLGDGPAQGTYTWMPPQYLSCQNCRQPVANPPFTMNYGLIYTDSNSCYFMDSVTVFVLGNIYVPNTFTVDENGLNEVFFAYGTDIEKMELSIFNRWGELIYKSEGIEKGWNGFCGGVPCKQDTYVYRILYTEKWGREGEIIGHINLLR